VLVQSWSADRSTIAFIIGVVCRYKRYVFALGIFLKIVIMAQLCTTVPDISNTYNS